MADSQKNTNNSDEIDLGQLFQLIGKGLNRIGIGFLKIFIYLKKNALILLGLIIVGLAVGFGLNQMTSKRLKTEVIVKPNFESKNYLYDVVFEIQANIKARDTTFFNSIGIKEIDFSGLEVKVSRVKEEGASESDLQYLELLKSFDNTDAISDIVRAELQNKSSFNQRITFYYKNIQLGESFVTGVVAYINQNQYFDGLLEISRSNASSRIAQNQLLLKQVDEIIKNYTTGLAAKGNKVTNERIVLDNQEQVNIADLFEYKNSLIRDIEAKKIELERQTDAVSIINLGKPQEIEKSFFGKNVVLIPVLLIGAFFLVSFFGYMNKKSKEL